MLARIRPGSDQVTQGKVLIQTGEDSKEPKAPVYS